MNKIKKLTEGFLNEFSGFFLDVFFRGIKKGKEGKNGKIHRFSRMI